MRMGVAFPFGERRVEAGVKAVGAMTSQTQSLPGLYLQSVINNMLPVLTFLEFRAVGQCHSPGAGFLLNAHLASASSRGRVPSRHAPNRDATPWAAALSPLKVLTINAPAPRPVPACRPQAKEAWISSATPTGHGLEWRQHGYAGRCWGIRPRLSIRHKSLNYTLPGDGEMRGRSEGVFRRREGFAGNRKPIAGVSNCVELKHTVSNAPLRPFWYR